MSDRTVPAFRRDNGRGQIIQGIIQQASQKFDPDIWAAMDKRDNALVEDEIVHGAQSSAFVYSIPIGGGKRAEGITVVGARQLAAAYQGIQATVISTLSKRGAMFISRSFPYGGFPGRLDVQQIPDLRDEEDFYEVMIEVHDLKTSNKIPSSRREYRFESRSEEALRKNPNLPAKFERQHLEQIAFSKAYRNGVVSLIPQDAVLQFKAKNLALNSDESFVTSLIDEKRSGVLRYAASRAIGVDRDAVESLTFDQIAGLADAVREGSVEQFVQSAEALGIVVLGDGERGPSRIATVATPSQPAARQASNGATQHQGKAEEQPKQAAGKKAQAKQEGPPAGHPAAGEGAPEAQETEKPLGELKKAEADKPIGEEKKQEAKGFDHYALDEISGEPIEREGKPLHFTKPGTFALWYNDRYITSENKEALRYNNEDALEEARLDPAAKVIIDAVHDPKGEQEDKKREERHPEVSEMKVPLEMLPNGRPNWPKYVIAAKESLASKVKSEPEMSTWIAVNEPVYSASKSVTDVKIAPLLEATRERLAKPVEDTDLLTAQGIIRNLDTVKRQTDYDSLVSNPAIRSQCERLGKERPDLRDMIKTADKAAVERIKPKQQTQPASGPEDKQMQGPEYDGPLGGSDRSPPIPEGEIPY